MNFTGSTFPLAARKQYASIFKPMTRTGACNIVPNATYVGRIICTYAIHNLKTGQAYVGSSENFANRWSGHLNELTRGTHINKLLQAAFETDGVESFTMSIITQYETTDGLLKAEAVDALANYKIEDLYNGRIGMIFSPHYPHGAYNRNRKPTKRPGCQSKLRWFHGETTL